jgi:hypothetical protein
VAHDVAPDSAPKWHQRTASLAVDFKNGTTATVPVLWVGAPIDAGLFFYQAPRGSWKAVEAVIALSPLEGARTGYSGDVTACEACDPRRPWPDHSAERPEHYAVTCQECGSGADADWCGWRACRIDDPDGTESAEVAFYCPACAIRELDSR